MSRPFAVLAVIALGACGRLGFDELPALDDAAAGDGAGDSVIPGAPFTIDLSGTSSIVGVATLPDGGAVVVGSAQGPTMFGGKPLDGIGAQDALIAAISPLGEVRWAKLLGGAQNDFALAVATAADGTIYVTGLINGASVLLGGAALTGVGDDVFVASYSADGAHRWSIRVGGNTVSTAFTDGGSAIAIAPNGDIVVGGALSGPVDFGSGVDTIGSAADNDAFVARFTSTGTAVWARRWGVTGTNSVDDVAVALDGGIFVSGSYSGTPDLGTGAAPNRGGPDAFVIGVTPTGGNRWNATFGGPNFDRLYGIEVSGTTVIASGYYWDAIDLPGIPSSTGKADGVVVGYSTSGMYQWSTRYGGTGCDFSTGMGLVDGKAAIAGTYSGPIDLGAGPHTPTGGTDNLVFQTADGSVGWSAAFGDASDEIANGIAGSVASGVYVVGARNQAYDGGCYQTASTGYVTRL